MPSQKREDFDSKLIFVVIGTVAAIALGSRFSGITSFIVTAGGFALSLFAAQYFEM
ncbi:MAG TPA: hypothetical protein VLI90_14965 [Tepidisphaeraceae bacterium]|nr:hypothetical protein [Tepidisphaeraceae bacterium]